MNEPHASLDVGRALYEQEVIRRVLMLREDLVRHDENLAAWELLDKAIPYFIKDHPAIVEAREDQRAMVAHVLDEDSARIYRDYYRSNPHERPFEEQYGIAPEDAHKHLYRVQFLREELEALCERRGAAPKDLQIIDLSANDGWMGINLGQLGYTVDCVDLHPGNCDLARTRQRQKPGIGSVRCMDLHDLDAGAHGRSDVVVCFETLEHVRDPFATVALMRELVVDDGLIVVSTPHEAIEQGNVPGWAHVEPKGHVRAVRAKDLADWLKTVGEIKRIELGGDRVMVASVLPGS